MRARFALGCLVCTLLLTSPIASHLALAEGSHTSDLKRLSLEQLMAVEVTSAGKKPERLSETAAAVSVITQEDIRRSGATTLVEALRLVPGVHVARIDANTWAVGIRGFTSRLSRAMLVLIDGRSVYTPLFAGVYWEVQDTLLEDVDHIEVIRGPGGTLWGANAVAGVVNIITKKARDTQGTLVTGGGGTEERGFGGARYGGAAGEQLYYRVYGKGFDRTSGFSRGPTRGFDGAHMGQGGFRLDWAPRLPDNVTVQGDFYDGEIGRRTAITRLVPPSLVIATGDPEVSGANVLGRWSHRFAGGSDSALQLYYDRTAHHEINFREDRHTFDLDFQHRLGLPYAQELVWGLGYRMSSGDVSSVRTVAFTPSRRTDQLFQGFVQDEIRLIPDLLRVTVGSKFEHNDYSGVEAQPSARVLVTPGGSHVLWGAISRPVRTPSRVEDDLELDALLRQSPPVFARLKGDRRFRSETALAYEAGYRVQPLDRLFLDLAGFYNAYDDLLGIDTGRPFQEQAPSGPRTVIPFFLRNQLQGDGYGGELAADARLTDWWRLRASYSYLELHLRRDSGGADTTVASTEGSSPHNLASLYSYLDLPGRLELDTMLHYVDNLPSQHVGSYVNLDLRLGWHVRDDLELALVGQNLLAEHHAEFSGGNAGSVEISRGMYGKVTWRY